MSLKSLEARVSELERQLASLRAPVPFSPGPNDWQKTIGMFAGDEVMAEIFEEGRKWREAERSRTRHGPRRPACKTRVPSG